MGATKQAEGHHLSYVGDSLANIQACLNCPFPKCTNCLSGQLKGYANVVQIERRQKVVHKKTKLSRGEQAVIKYYAIAETDGEIASLSGMSESAVNAARKNLGLLPAFRVPPDTKQKLISQILEDCKASGIRT